MAVPYTEALFCLLTALAFYGIVTNNKLLIWITLFLLALTRATSLFLLPCMLVMEVIANERRNILRSIWVYIVQYTIPILTGLALFVWIQYLQTGVWFAYFKQQEKYLGHKWAIPVLPLSNPSGGQGTTWLAGLAVFVALVVFAILLKHINNWAKGKTIIKDKVLTLSLTYFPVTLFCIVFCSPTWGGTTNLTALHRYTFATPFIFVLLHYIANRETEYKPKDFIVIFLLCNISWLLMGSYLHIQSWLYWNFVSLLVFVYLLYANSKLTDKYEWAPYLLITFNFFIQASLFQHYLKGIYTD